MTDTQLMAAILDSLKDPVLFCDTNHIMRYMNKAAVEHYEEGENLLGRSVMDCHNERSRETIVETCALFEAGENERLISDNDKHRVYMRAVRNTEGKVVGYYERYEPPRVAGAE
jgi:nitrogen-specific signal transduction histidine kinase